jgi:hypothetical protein
MVYARCHVDVVSDKQGLPGRQSENEPLMATPDIVIG